MPLPVIPFAPSEQLGPLGLNDLTLVDDSHDDLDGILSMLGGNNFSKKTANSKSQNSSNPSKETPNSGVSRKTSNSHDIRRVKFDPVVDKLSRRSNLEDPLVSQQIKLDSEKALSVELVADSRKINVSATQRDGNINKINQRRDKTSTQAEPCVTSALTQQFATPVHMEGMQKPAEVTSEHYEDLVHRILSSQRYIQEICIGIKELQTSATASSIRGNETSKSIEKLIEGVTKSHDQLKLVTECVRLRNAGDKENIIELQLCAENERKEFMEQLSKEKSKLEDRWDSYEKNVALLCAQRKELEMERDAVLMEKANLLKEQMKFQQNEALFEQRKLAANDEMNISEGRIATLYEMDAKLQSEMDRLHELSDYVTRKDAEVNKKLAEADALFRQAKEHESTLLSAVRVINEQKQQLSDDRFCLAQERVSMLKEKSQSRVVTTTQMNLKEKTKEEKLRGCFRLNSSPDLLLRRRLPSIKVQLDELRKE